MNTEVSASEKSSLCEHCERFLSPASWLHPIPGCVGICRSFQPRGPQELIHGRPGRYLRAPYGPGPEPPFACASLGPPPQGGAGDFLAEHWLQEIGQSLQGEEFIEVHAGINAERFGTGRVRKQLRRTRHAPIPGSQVTSWSTGVPGTDARELQPISRITCPAMLTSCAT